MQTTQNTTPWTMPAGMKFCPDCDGQGAVCVGGPSPWSTDGCADERECERCEGDGIVDLDGDEED